MFLYFLQREVKNKYNSTWSTLFWLVIQPMLTLSVYYFVFTHIFNARLGDDEHISFIAYLAIGLWPWMAFSEALARSVTSVSERKDLIGKVKIDLRVVLLANISAIYIFHLIGFLIVVTVLMIFSEIQFSAHYFLFIIPFLILYFVSYSIGLLVASVHVFYKDILQIINALLPLMFFTVPIIYSINIIPVEYHNIMSFNPLFEIINSFHHIFFYFDKFSALSLLKYCMVIVPIYFFTNWFYKKLAPEFDDYI
ncbi:ABC transporter permease [Marinicella litoralis]|uniref:Transport permease protein n=1 Tax=Marinicella litoralis TaxID=644220 RepID=A0A4R6XMC7_9GAMM|nr:ABC transporter permease [Marinicella litoralis]TDR20812.1 lipopolysaccharide transport system permease protein [Marinicella litoralis]